MKKSSIAITLIVLVLIGGCTAVGFAIWSTPGDVIEFKPGKHGVQIDLTDKIFGENTDKLLPIGAGDLRDTDGNAYPSYNGNAIAKMAKLKIKIVQDEAAKGISFSLSDLRINSKKIPDDIVTLYFLSGYSDSFDYLHYIMSNGEIKAVADSEEGTVLPHYLGAVFDKNTETYHGGSYTDKAYTEYMAVDRTYEFTMLVTFTETAADFREDIDCSNGDLTFTLTIETNI